MRTSLPDLLVNGRPILADGAIGTMLFSMGLEQGRAVQEQLRREGQDHAQKVPRVEAIDGSAAHAITTPHL
ncbi:MAG: hypothetical protein BMS9Abin28_1401 [Anaerolineae bacterium]|nr:MAG: hypothetical protein BMS9Abin28_1401 [Anaerolineae bacterium]